MQNEIFVNDLLKLAKKEVVLIDNYIDDTVFTLFGTGTEVPAIDWTKVQFPKFSR
ncbi:hypothetical protein [Arcobacter vandammei]|uniref:hypothetical protein n=1 Tax=Arcobacter vandammei TaxID=2782243 RepID=UPI0018DF712D|nr:hypothetical protein [Arcobacter vandammei]